MRKFRVGYDMLIDGEIVHHTKCVLAYNGHDAKSRVSRSLFERGILHAIKTDFFTFPGLYFMDRSTAALHD